MTDGARAPGGPGYLFAALPVLLVTLLSAGPAHAQITRDLQVQGIAVFSSAQFTGGGVGYALRPPARLRFGAVVSAGTMAGDAAGRGEIFASFHLNPGQEHGF